ETASSTASAFRAVEEQVDDDVGFGFERIAAAAENPVRRHLVERAEEDLRGDGRLDVAAEDAVALAVFDRLSNQAEVVAQQRRGEALHELRRLPELHLKDDREIAIAAQTSQVQARKAAEPLARVAELGARGAPFLERRAHAALEQRDAEQDEEHPCENEAEAGDEEP